jgi:hypothetical protein
VRFAPQSPVIAAKFANLNWLCHNPRARRPADQGLPWRRPSAHQHDPEKSRFSEKIMLKCKTNAHISRATTLAIAFAVAAAGHAGGFNQESKCPR